VSRVLITGAAGVVGTKLAATLRDAYELRFTDIVRPRWVTSADDFVAADLTDFGQVLKAADGVSAVIHLGGVSTEAPFDETLPANFVGVRNVFEAARQNGAERVIFPSSNQALGYFRLGQRIPAQITLRPSGWYGVSKAFGEAVGALYADKYGLRVFVIRIGRHAGEPENVRGLALWISIEDLTQLIRIGLDHPDVHYEVVYGISDNDRAYFDNQRATDLGYQPTSRAEDFAEGAYRGERSPRDAFAERFVGGPLTSRGFTGDPRRAGKNSGRVTRPKGLA
jgi:uronate dehydrogenase